jgi:hypothetical protein
VFGFLLAAREHAVDHGRMSHLRLAITFALLATSSTLAVAGDEKPTATTTAMGCFPGADGVLTGGPVNVPVSVADEASFINAPFTTLWSSGPASNRVDIVFVGDGFQASQLASYASIIDTRWQTMKATDPYVSYLSYFNVHRVDVTSVDSGVDNDPTQGVVKNTAMDSYFWCSGIERLLCANTAKAQSFASSAPDWDQILLAANSTKYGGAGYLNEDVCTFSAFEGSSLQIALHELGHSFGNLADEYDYADGTTYSGPEVPEPNVSIQTQAQMQSSGSKWAPWIGTTLPVVGLHGAFQGARYYQFGIRRPTNNSLMRTLGLPFNGPCLEQMIIEIHKATKMLDSSSAPVDATVVRGTALSTVTVEPVSHALTKTWSLNGVAIPGANGNAIDTTSIDFDGAQATLTLTLIDPTSKVKNEALRATWLTETYSWKLVPPPCVADLNNSGIVDSTDLGMLLGSWGNGFYDLNADGLTNAADLSILLGAWGACP